MTAHPTTVGVSLSPAAIPLPQEGVGLTRAVEGDRNEMN